MPITRLIDDPTLSNELRHDLIQELSAGQDYDPTAKLESLRSALARDAVARTEHSAADGDNNRDWYAAEWSIRNSPWIWRLALVAAIGGSVAATVNRTAHKVEPVPLTNGAQLDIKPVSPTASPNDAAGTVAPPVDAPSDFASERENNAKQLPEPGEIELLLRIRALLARDPQAAYQLALRSETDFPHATLAEEREALKIVALAKLGAVREARRQSREFLARHPKSPMLGRLRWLLRP